VVESQPSKLLVAGSIPVSRSRSAGRRAKAPKPKGWSRNEGFVLHLGLRPSALGLVKADVAQLAERVLGKDEVTSSILVIGSIRLGRFAPSLMASRARAAATESNALSEQSESKGRTALERHS
jgi:hypothetical protein